MKILRTPEERFDHLEGYPFASHYVEVSSGLRMHYLDEGPREAHPVLLLHGEPTWSYLYRKMVPPLVSAGFRVVAPDLIGFGKSDKPAARRDYTYALHEQWLLACIDSLDLEPATLFCQDWGSLLGLRIAGEQPQRFARIMVSNGFLPIGDTGVPFILHAWRAFARYSPWFPVGSVVQRATVEELSPAEVAAYDAPFPSNAFKAGVRAFPGLVPIKADDPATPANRRAWDGLGRFDRPFLCVFGRHDPILGKLDQTLIEHVPGARGQPHDRIRGGHFIQEDQGDELAKRLIAWAQEA
jgi:haloalkane dehalogenase